MDLLAVTAVGLELAARLTGWRLSRVVQPGPTTLVLEWRGAGRGARRLVVHAGPPAPRLHLTARRPSAL
ncbi:MAG TPA: NFACT family protein, partial [Thermodesulfobacteriota bacterium]|nr:NFACT family protein [Thermodesulfobacteriota bacterium]